jgi:HK97 family phage prohead protease
MSQPIFVRAFPTVLEQKSPHELLGRFVPFDVPTKVADPLPSGRWDIYVEGFKRGAFAPQADSREPGVLRRIGLVHTHEGGLGYLGPVVSLREEDDGLWGDVAVLRSKASDVEDLIAAGVDQLSVEFRLPSMAANTVVVDGVRWRTRAHLDQVALEPKGSYPGARVAAFRADIDELAREQAEAEAAEEAAAKEAADAAAKAKADEEAAAERRRRWDELCARTEAEEARSAEYHQRFGISPS